jgi:aerobic carbon-monoxide dehydrogenase large subunit
MVRGRG